ncbi:MULTISPECIES: copper resistance protein B [unclassified Novosphingobium]|uniref:copper resistance protein B n=1 Tax=unclassified Novosphingobium TaxID=2644732 RepID=UPI00146F31A5|nr:MULTISPECIES: copper resistance protein B [unclassified Novosphingobium]NMN05102.1 copper resistance protein B [Novosphingobium sp. SG919]NMN87397.1 copper resistance protein B [Novosphingobium sp. SG916]
MKRGLGWAAALALGSGVAHGQEAPPAPPADHAADALFDPQAMARARTALVRESGGMAVSQVMVDQLELRGGDDYAWEAKGWWGGDSDRLAVETRGEGAFGGRLDRAEAQAGWLHALDPWFNLRAGLRQDLGAGQGRTHAALTIEGLAPYWFDVETSVFLSTRGEVSGRAEASYDQRVTQRLVAQPRVELDWAAQAMPDLHGDRSRDRGAGIDRVEAGLRLRYELRRTFAPYLGLSWERQLGGTARAMRAGGEKAAALRALAGVRVWW